MIDYEKVTANKIFLQQLKYFAYNVGSIFGILQSNNITKGNAKETFMLNLFCLAVCAYSGIKRSDMSALYNVTNPDYIEFNRLYNQILDRIVKLSKELENDNIVSHHTLLEFLYKENIFSIDPTTKLVNLLEADSRTSRRKEFFVEGALFLNDHGVCRNGSVLEKDFFDKLGYEATVISGKMNGINNKEKLKELFKDDYSFLGDIDQIIDNLSEDDLKERFSLIEILLGNHQICAVNNNRITYYLDLYNKHPFFRNGTKILEYKGISFRYINVPKLLMNNENNESKIKLYNSTSIEEYNRIHEDTLNKINSNKDIIYSCQKDLIDPLMLAEDQFCKIMKKTK